MMEKRWPILYCERGDLSIYAEPLNTVSNLAFLAAALLALRAYQNAGLNDRWIAALIALTVLIFAGSTAFHAAPNRITVLMDVIPIQMFMLAYLALALRRFLNLPVAGTVLGILMFIGLIAALQILLPDRRLAAVSAYLAALLALLVVGAWAILRGEAAGRWLLAAGCVFAFSLTMRQLDLPWCPVIPIGTHWLWHLANGSVLGLLLAAAIYQAARSRDAAHH
jgi:hypothetical protein